MALDGAFLYAVRRELGVLISSRCDKIFQPSRDEIIISFKTREGTKKLVVSASADNARVNLTELPSDNPKTPPMFCMLLRKKIGSGRLCEIRQDGLERILYFDFDCVNDFGEPERLTLAAEIMGRRSNIILIAQNGKIIDSIKRVDLSKSRERPVLPALIYALPPRTDRLSFIDCGRKELIEKIKSGKDAELSKAIMSSLEGVSPVLAREWAFFASKTEVLLSDCNDEIFSRLSFAVEQTKHALLDGNFCFCTLSDRQGRLRDFSFINISQYGSLMIAKQHDSACETLDYFFAERDRSSRLMQRANDLFRLLSSLEERIRKRLDIQRRELDDCENKIHYKLCGDLISANIYRVSPGDSLLTCENFYDEALPSVEIQLDPRLSAAKNAQRFYTEYRKKSTAESKLAEQIKLGADELAYIESVFDSLTRAENEDDILLLRRELTDSGYIRAKKQSGAKPKELPPREYTTSDGFKVLVGRNNNQNDRLTLKIASKQDIWLHTKNIPGAHVIIITDGKEITPQAIFDAAKIAVANSKANGSVRTPVDWCPVRYVKKPSGAKPGMVIFSHNKTVFVESDDASVADG